MAGTAATQPFLVDRDWTHGSLIYSILIDGTAPEIRPSEHPVARWSLEHNFSAFAVSGSHILGIIQGSRDMVVHDTSAQAGAPGPQLRDPKCQPAMLPVEGGTVVVMDTHLRCGSCCFEALRRLPDGSWRADPLPEPPLDHPDDDDPEDDDDEGYLSICSYFTIGARVWISVTERGTFSLDTERGTAWRMEGRWELPLKKRGFFVPELELVIGLGSCLGPGPPGERCCQVCALDVAARPPVVRQLWQIPAECAQDVPTGEMVSLAYLGNGRICVSRSVVVDLSKARGTTFMGTGTSFTVADVRRLPNGDLQLDKNGKVHRHVWPLGQLGKAFFIQPA